MHQSELRCSYNRVYTVVDYADDGSRAAISEQESHLICAISSAEVNQVGTLLEIAQRRGMTMGRLSFANSFSTEVPGLALDRPTLLVELVVLEAHPRIDSFLSGVSSSIPSIQVVQVTPQVVEDVFLSCNPPAAQQSYALCVIKPHILRDGRAGRLLTEIVQASHRISHLQRMLSYCYSKAGYDITGIQRFHLNGSMAESFFGVYKVS